MGAMVGEDDVVTIVDTEAGLEHFSRGTERSSDTLLVVLEPYYKSLETGRRAAELGKELGIARVLAVANKIRDDLDRTAVRDYALAHHLELIAEVPYDDSFRRAEAAGGAPIDAGADAPGIRAIQGLAGALIQS